MNIIGKTISVITKMKQPGYDDTGWLKLDFTDGTHCIICGDYGGYTGESVDEYPTRIWIQENVDGLIPCT